MLQPAFQDLIKPQWRRVLVELKQSGGMPVSDLARLTGHSYMGTKGHCDALTKAGYLMRTRLPRTAVGRPEIIYSLTEKADALLPQAGIDFTLELLDGVKRMFGESAPEKLLYQYFQKRLAAWSHELGSIETPEAKASALAKLRTKNGCLSHYQQADATTPAKLVELHNPLQPVFDHFPRARTLELGLIEELLGIKVERKELATTHGQTPRVEFLLT